MQQSRRSFLKTMGLAGAAGALAPLTLSGCNERERNETLIADPPEPALPEKLTEKQILDGIESRVQRYRTADARLKFVDAREKPLKQASVRITQRQHEFKLGTAAFRLDDLADKSLQELYRSRYTGLLNYATLPFYWSMYESESGKDIAGRLERMADWCDQNQIAVKGHPLLWNALVPAWLEKWPESDVLKRAEQRVRGIVAQFKDRIQFWDVFNEASGPQTDSAIGRWVKARGAAAAVAQALSWAHEANPNATLLYNDYNVSEAFEKLVGDLTECRAPLHAVGVQSHMHKARWTFENLWNVCSTYGRFGAPVHFTETTVLSGAYMKPEDNDYEKPRTDWPTTPEGEAIQADYGEAYYSILFSHPAVDAVSWWDLTDFNSWLGAPSGLLRKDMSPKPIYERVQALFRRHWTTDVSAQTDKHGLASARCFFGTHQAVARLDCGTEVQGEFHFSRRGGRELTVLLQ